MKIISLLVIIFLLPIVSLVEKVTSYPFENVILFVTLLFEEIKKFSHILLSDNKKIDKIKPPSIF